MAASGLMALILILVMLQGRTSPLRFLGHNRPVRISRRPLAQTVAPPTKNHAHDSKSAAPMRGRKVLILGGGDVGSAVAHVLFRRGLRVLICERPRSAHARRGMAFTDALFDGRAMLEGVQARCLPDMPAVEACWAAADAVPIVTIPESVLIAASHFDVIVNATMKRTSEPLDLRPLAGFSVGLGPGYAPGHNCDVAIETQWGPTMGQVLRDQPAAVRSGGPHPLAGVTRERFAIAPCAGTWKTAAVLGQQVRAGDPLGQLGEHSICAPIDGQLRGLVRDGVEVLSEQRLIEVDPRAEPQVAGLGERPLAVANSVAEILDTAFGAGAELR
jgi:xanthine dehydrogenase accessory factor